MTKLSLYFHTLRYLKPLQIYRRFWFLLTKPLISKRLAPPRSEMSNPFTEPGHRKPSLIDSKTFFFLNQSGNLDYLGWDDSKEAQNKEKNAPKLWRYNQHYFDDLNASDSISRSAWHRSLLIDWVKINLPGDGVGWDPYPTSLRIVNWIKWQCNGSNLPDSCLDSLSTQTRWLVKRIEWHILGNHLFSNAKALVFAGLFFEGKEADSWLSKGLKIISDEIDEQILDDGGNFELSPMYHSIFLEDLLDLINIANAFPKSSISKKQIADWHEASIRMLCWLDIMTHPDGEISFFNDSAMNIALNPLELKKYAERLGIFYENPNTNIRLNHLIESGYLRISHDDSIALIDAANVGPDYLPGHAHADTLSFELSIHGKRFLVNTGTSEYGHGDIRQLERSTAAHNTVSINNQNSSEVWSGFRVARRAYPRGLTINEQSDCLEVSCTHDGYRRLKGKPTHHRRWLFSGCSVVIEDEIEGQYENAFSYFHLHPSIEFLEKDYNKWVMLISEKYKANITIENGDAKIIPSHFSPEFGIRIESKCIRVTLGPKGSSIRIDWSKDNY